MEKRQSILVIEDSKQISELIEIYIGTQYQVYTAETGEEGLEKFREEKIDLVLLDIVLPGINGLEVLTEIRKEEDVPVIILSSKDLDMDIILGLKMGADDYLTKPFNPLELDARIEAHLRRKSMGEQGKKGEMLKVQDLKLDLRNPVLYYKEERAELLPTEYKILKVLMESPGQVFTKKQIYEIVWEEEYAYDDNTIMVHISKLREKLEKMTEKRYIKTIRGLGYRFER
ncbi:MAG: response regulator transcription factor [Gallicola sp.]|nr:response regulator transcription factor [Gallicola sp.]